MEGDFPASSADEAKACHATYVMVFDKDEVSIANRCSPVKPFEQSLNLKCTSLLPNEPVKLPSRPTTGMSNPEERRAMLEEYQRNPLVFTVSARASEPPSRGGEGMYRHFLGFGFSRDTPYFPPGTIIQFDDISVKITGMVVGSGHRTHEYAVILSLDRDVHPDAASAFLQSYNLTEIDGGDEGMCSCLASIIRKYTYAVGDVDPSCASTDAMEESVARKFEDEMERMFVCASSVATRRPVPHREGGGEEDDEDAMVNFMGHADDDDYWDRRSACIMCAFSWYRQTLLNHMRHQPLGTREWMQMFESFMAFSCAEHGLGFMDFVLE